jgi:hypothetical protein
VKETRQPFLLSTRGEEILKEMRFYRYMTALDICYLMYSPSALTWVRDVLAKMCGGEDFVENQYLYRFRLADVTLGNQKVYTLGARGRRFLESELGISCPWYFRPSKVQHISYGQIMHNLVLTRFLVAARHWAAQSQGEFTVAEARISYDLAGVAGRAGAAKRDKREVIPVIPDAWIMFAKEKREGGARVSFPIFLEIDRGTMYRQRFKKHVSSRIEFVRSGGYAKLFGTKAVMILYATTGEREEYKETRVKALRAWTKEVLTEMNLPSWAGIFRFGAVSFADMYKSLPFEKGVWFRLDIENPVELFEG